MTTIKSSDGRRVMLIGDIPVPSKPDHWSIHIEPTRNDACEGFGGNWPIAELAAALGLVTREEVAALRAELDELNSNPWKARCQEARNELDEAKATIARVRHLRDVSGDTVGVEELDAALDPKPASKQVILTADMAGVKVNGYDFTKGVIVALPAEDADRLISAGLAKETTDE